MVTPDELVDRTRALISAHRDADEVAFLGAQFDAGLAWVAWPDGFGGLGANPGDQKVIDDELERVGRRYPWNRNPMGIGMVGPSIMAHGTDEQRHRHLRRIFTAEDIWCQLFSEPGAGSDVATLATRAERDGDSWVVNGQKVWTSMAQRARYGLLLARSDPEATKHEGLTTFILQMDLEGVDRRPLRQLTGRSGDFSEVFFSDVHIADSWRVGEPGLGWRVAISTLMNERVSIGGTVEARDAGAIGRVLASCRQRPVKGVLRDRVVRAWADNEVHRLSKMRAQALRERGTPGPEGSLLKLAGALIGQRTSELLLDLRGASGQLVDYELSERDLDSAAMWFLQSQAATIAGGTTDVMLNIIGERVLGLPREPDLSRTMPWNQIPRGA
jgi:alkylation response protein AidB-like acyl-CoA dehydrogenase